MKHDNQLHCCLGCGRDTRGYYCSRCIGHAGQQAGKGRGYRARPAVPDMPLEDDYSEESDADSVCEDASASTSRVA